MKRLFFLLLMIPFSGFTQSEKIVCGMTSHEFRKLKPGIIPETVYCNDELTHDEKLYFFDGTWYYDFKRDTLRTLFYSDNLGDTPRKGYGTTWHYVYRALSMKLGNPYYQKFKIEDTLLTENRVRKENSDTVLFAAWKSARFNIHLGIYYTGNKKIKMDPQDMVSQTTMNEGPSINYYLFTINYTPAKNNAIEMGGMFPGISALEAYQVNQSVFPNGLGVSGQWNEELTKSGLKGNCSYNFRSGRLQSILWSHYAGKADKATYEKLLKSTDEIVIDYTNKYGEPEKIAEEKEYKDPHTKRHYGYDILKYRWETDKVKVEVEYYFSAGKGMHDLMVKTEEIAK